MLCRHGDCYGVFFSGVIVVVVGWLSQSVSKSVYIKESHIV